MARVKEIRYCVKCGEQFNRSNGNTDAKYCSRLCACRARNTKEHQVRAGRAGGAVKAATRGMFTKKSTYIKEKNRHQHRLVMENHLGRQLTKDEVVHHIDEDKHNNHISNLQVMSREEHARHHFSKKP